jgi:hypothetical protein
MMIEQVACVAHEANRAFCAMQGDKSQVAWADAPEWQRESTRNKVAFHRALPNSQPSDSHEAWMAKKVATGWVYGPVKDITAKTHPCIVPYTALPEVEQVKYALFIGVVRALEWGTANVKLKAPTNEQII